MWDCIIPYPLRNRTSTDDIHFRCTHTLVSIHFGPTFGAPGSPLPSSPSPCSPLPRVALFHVALFHVTLPQVALSCYVPTLNENTNDRASSLIEVPNPNDWPDRWEKLLSLSTTPHSCVETDVGLYHSIPLEKPDVHRRHSLLENHTLVSIHFGPTFGAPSNHLLGSPFLGTPLPLRINS